MENLRIEGNPQRSKIVRSGLLLVRTYFRPALKWAAMIVIVTELGGIWSELHHIRNEQVKNKWYALAPEVKRRIPAKVAKRWESTSEVQGTVSIDGDVTVEQPVEVEIDR